MPIETQNPKETFAGYEEHAQEHWLDLPDGRMRYLKAGSGPALILIHGLMGYSFSWRFTIPALARHATVYAIDNLGAGFSTANEGTDASAGATAKRVLQFTEALDIKHFDLLGTSHGGGVAIMVAAICAARRSRLGIHPSDDTLSDADVNDGGLRRLVLVAPINPWSPHGKRLAPFLGGRVGSFIVRNTIERGRFLDYLWLRRLFADGAKIPPDSLEGYRMPVFKNHAFRHATRIVKSWTADLAELETALPTTRDCPTLLIWGTKDRAVTFQSAERLRRNFRDVRLVALEGVGHLPYEEAPEDFNRALIDFLVG